MARADDEVDHGTLTSLMGGRVSHVSAGMTG
jgi:hypothetical protein